jgi:hypothetical protein
MFAGLAWVNFWPFVTSNGRAYHHLAQLLVEWWRAWGSPKGSVRLLELVG